LGKNLPESYDRHLVGAPVGVARRGADLPAEEAAQVGPELVLAVLVDGVAVRAAIDEDLGTML
jgi:hypothetical protein